MTQIDLDDLPPRMAKLLSEVAPDDELVLVRGGAVVARLRLAEKPSPAPPGEDLPPEEGMKEVMEHFEAMIHDTF